jgi:hypothetical protein
MKLKQMKNKGRLTPTLLHNAQDDHRLRAANLVRGIKKKNPVPGELDLLAVMPKQVC